MSNLINISPGIKATLVGAFANLLLSVAKFIGGVAGNSTALVADALHSLSDLLTDAIVLATHKIGQIPADSNHPYGHGRADTIGATTEAPAGLTTTGDPSFQTPWTTCGYLDRIRGLASDRKWN